MRKLHVLLAVSSLAWLLLAGGCSRSEYGHVSGVVKINGQPVEGAVVTFSPEEGGRSAFGTTGPDGSYELDYAAGAKGAKIGVNRVYISTYESPELDDNERVVVPAKPERFPPEYNVGSSVTREVKPGDNTIDFDVEADQESYPRSEDEDEQDDDSGS